MAHLTNFSFEFFMKFSQNMPVYFFYIMVQKSEKTQIKGSCLKVARNKVENASFAQRSAHRDSRIWRPELIEPAAERKRRARGRRPTFNPAPTHRFATVQYFVQLPPIMFGFSESADIGLSF